MQMAPTGAGGDWQLLTEVICTAEDSCDSLHLPQLPKAHSR